MNKDDLEDKIKSLARKRDNAVLELDKYQKELQILMEEYYEVSDEYVKVECIQCRGVGYIKGEDNKKHLCGVCGGNNFLWLKKWKEK